MKRSGLVVVIVAAALLLAAPVYAQTGKESPGGFATVSQHQVREIGPGGGDREPPMILSQEMQYVGITTQTFKGDAGVLNMSRACSQEFRGGRMCTVQEVNMSVSVPRPPVGSGKAWVQNLGLPAGSYPDNNCNGWTAAPSTLSMRVNGTTFAWAGECYGGIVLENCASRLPVVCCSKFLPYTSL